MKISMDTDAVRAMSSRLRHTSDSMDESLASIKATVISANWQSQAREEFIMQMEMLQRSSAQSTAAMRMMAQAADQKADQWEAIAHVFNGPFYFLEGVWNSVKNFFAGIGNNAQNAMNSIRIPSLPSIVLPSISGAVVIGGINNIIPKWKWDPPNWWPFKKNKDIETGSRGRSWGEEREGNQNRNKEESKDDEWKDNSSQDEDYYESKFDGSEPAPGMNSTYGIPGQLPLDPPVTSSDNNRNPELYKDVINQFAVGNNPRYSRDEKGRTFCNTFAGDVARAMDVPFPQKREFGMDPKDQATIGFPQLYDYFTDPKAPVKARDAGWVEVNKNNLSQLESHVNGGKMAVVVNNGHIAVVKPGQSISSFETIKTSQAGAVNSNNLTLSQGFGSSPEPKIYIIE